MDIRPQDKILFYSKIAYKLDIIVEFLLVQLMKEERMIIFKSLEKD